MNLSIAAIYEHGVFRPAEPVPLEEGAAVRLVVLHSLPTELRSEDGDDVSDNRTPAEILARIAAIPEPDGEPFSGADHDKILYGPEGTR